MEDAEKFSVDSAEGKPELENSKQGEQEGEHKQQEKLHAEDPNSCEEMGKRDQNIVQSEAEHQSDSVGNGMEVRGVPRKILEEQKPNKNASDMDGDKGSGDNDMQGGKTSSEDPQQLTESPLDNEPNDKIVVSTVTADGDAGCNEMPENNDEVGQVEPVIPYACVKYAGEKSKDDSGDTSGTKMTEEEETGTPEDQDAFMKELESFYKERSMDFKPPKFYGQTLNCLKLYRSVTRLGGYDRVTGDKLWRQVGESFHPPRTCTTVSWTFRIFYEKGLLEYERHKLQNGELELALVVIPEPLTVENQTPGLGRVRRDAAARAMQGWHAQRHYTYGEVGEPIIKDKNLNKREKNFKSIGSLRHKRPSGVENQHPMKAARTETSKHCNFLYPVNVDTFRQCAKFGHGYLLSYEESLLQKCDIPRCYVIGLTIVMVVVSILVNNAKKLVTTVVDVGPPADWVKINVRESKDCFEVYALVPGLLREEVRVQSDPAGRLVITGQPEQLDSPWGITAFKKVVSLPARIDPLQTSAVVSLHGRLFVRVPFEQCNN